MLKLNALAMLHLKNKGDNELKLMINFPLKLFDFFSQSFPCIYFQGVKHIRGGNAQQERLRLTAAKLPLASSVAWKEQICGVKLLMLKTCLSVVYALQIF